MGTADQRPGWHRPLPGSPVGSGSPLLSARGPVASSADLGGGMGGQIGREELGLNRSSPPRPLGLQSQNVLPSRVSECFWPLPTLGKHGMGACPVAQSRHKTRGARPFLWCPVIRRVGVSVRLHEMPRSRLFPRSFLSSCCSCRWEESDRSASGGCSRVWLQYSGLRRARFG